MDDIIYVLYDCGCGGQAEMIKSWMVEYGDEYYVKCKKCGCMSQHFVRYGDKCINPEEDAVDNWNIAHYTSGNF